MVIDFFATWCPPCRMISPVFEELSAKYGGRVTFLKVDVDEIRVAAQKCGIESMPTFQGYYKGKLIGQVAGADKEKLEELIKKVAELGDENDEDEGGEWYDQPKKKRSFFKRLFKKSS
eukprot:evm.model.scf_898EXC.2 EVM.evm.TU.scf_898EXC.2   scf_898EXC:27086-29129(+)